MACCQSALWTRVFNKQGFMIELHNVTLCQSFLLLVMIGSPFHASYFKAHVENKLVLLFLSIHGVPALIQSETLNCH